MKNYKLKHLLVDSVELKCLLISRGVRVDKSVYKWAKGRARLDLNPVCCNCIILSCGTIVQLTDTRLNSQKSPGILNLLRKANDTPFILRINKDKPILFYEKEEVDEISFPPVSNFYHQHTSLGRPYLGNVAIQGLDWLTFQSQNLMHPKDLYEIVNYAIINDGITSLQINYMGESEENPIPAYLDIIEDVFLEEVILQITPPKDITVTDLYIEMGTSRIACSVEAWARARAVTPVLEYVAQKHGSAKALSNFIIGVEAFDSLAEGTSWLAEKGVLPTASVWMPTNKSAPKLDYYRRVKEHFAELYNKYGLEPPASKGLNVCIARDIWNYSKK